MQREVQKKQHISHREYHKGDYCISTNRARLDINAIHHFLSTQAYWCMNIPMIRVEEAIAHSLNFGLYYEEKQIGFARIVSDFSTVAYLGDVYILPEFRGRSLAKWLMKTVMKYPELQGLRRWILSTADAHGLYKQSGWSPVAYPERWMEVHDREVYTRIHDADL